MPLHGNKGWTFSLFIEMIRVFVYEGEETSCDLS